MDIQVLKRYTHQGLCRAIDIFNHPVEFPKRTRLLGFRFLLQYNHKDTVLAPNKEKIVAQMKQMIDEHYSVGTHDSHSVLMELVDMLIDFSPEDGEKLLAYLREQRAVANDAGPGVHDTGPECTVYGDSQSTHNKEISASTRRVAMYLGKNFALSFGNDAQGIQKKMQHYNVVKDALVQKFGDRIEPVIERIYIDNAHFGIGFTVDEILMAVLEWIDSEAKRYKDDPKKEEPFPTAVVMGRLAEELVEMNNYCSSGLLARIVNAIQGFTDGNENLAIRISGREQVKTVVYHYLNRQVQACGDDDVLDGLTSGGGKFISFVKTTVANKVDEWYKDYGDEFIQELTSVVNEYTSMMTYE